MPHCDPYRWFKIYSLGRRPMLRLFCCPYAGASARVFRSWRAHLPSEIELIAVQYPGREERASDAIPESLRTLAAGLATAMMPLLDGTPFSLLGHSLGALVAFELIHELRRLGLPLPRRLFVSAASGPRINAYARSPRHLWPDADFTKELMRLGGTPPEALADAQTLRLLLPTLRCDLGWVDTYVYSEAPPLPVPIDALGGLDDAEVPRDHLAQWEAQSSEGFGMTLFAGDHFYLHHAAPLLCDLIAERTEQDISVREKVA